MSTERKPFEELSPIGQHARLHLEIVELGGNPFPPEIEDDDEEADIQAAD